MWFPKKGFIFLRQQKEVWKKIVLFSPFYSSFGKQGLWLYFWQTPTYAISVSLTIKIYKNNIDTSRITNKQCFKIILNTKTRLKVFINKTDIFTELLPNTADISPRNCTRQYFFLSQMRTYFKCLLTGISANSSFRTEFDFEKLKMIYYWNIYVLVWLQASAFPNRNELYWNKYLPGLLMLCPGLLPTTV